MKSITVLLKGGLGNQLFQFAYGYSLSKKYNAQLFLDISFFQEDARHGGYMLDKFNLPSNIQYKNISKITKLLLRVDNKLKGVLNKFLKLGYVTENYQNVKKDTIVDGYWQNKSLSQEYKNDLINIFTLNLEFNNEALNAIYKIKNTNSVSVHIRRGDYLSKENSKIFYQLDRKYYQKAISSIDKVEGDATLFVFSNDSIWVKDNFQKYKNIVFITNNSPLIDFYLMSLCKHNIIANSTFSWWASYLNINKDKVTIAPQSWFKSTKQNQLNTENLLSGFIII